MKPIEIKLTAMKPTCGNCSYCEDDRCHLFPPRNGYPLVSAECWCAQHPALKRPGKAAKRRQPDSDAEWMTSIREQYRALGIDVDREVVKARAWLTTPKGKGRQFTRAFFLNWLNKQDRPMQAGGDVRSPEEVCFVEARRATAVAVWECIETNGRSDQDALRRTLRAARDKWGDVLWNGKDAVKAGSDLALNNRRMQL